MAEPGTWLAISAIAGTAMSAVGQVQAGQEQKKWSEYNAAVAARDAEASKQAAGYEAGQKRKETERLLGRQRALYGKAGVTFEGSPLELMEETAAAGELDAMMIEREGKLRGSRYMEEAQLSRMKGRGAARAGMWGAGSSLLTGGAQSYKYYRG